jgi:hypothetical protein
VRRLSPAPWRRPLLQRRQAVGDEGSAIRKVAAVMVVASAGTSTPEVGGTANMAVARVNRPALRARAGMSLKARALVLTGISSLLVLIELVVRLHHPDWLLVALLLILGLGIYLLRQG